MFAHVFGLDVRFSSATADHYYDTITAALQTGRVDAQCLITMLSLTVLKKNPSLGQFVLPTPIFATTSNAGFRRETDKTWRDYVNTWMHSGMVMVDKEKMSKSLGNFFTIRDVLAHYDPETVRYFLMSGHYRSQLNYSEDNLKQARAALERMYTALRDLPVAAAAGGDEQVARFKEAMDGAYRALAKLRGLLG